MERNSFSHQDSFQLLIEFSGARTTSRKSETQERSSLSGHVSHFSDQPHCAQHDLLQHRWDKPGKRNGHVSLFPINCDATRQDKTDPGLHKEDPKPKIVFVSSSSCRFRQAAGVDLEPDHPHEPMVNISFTDCSCVGNAGGGFQIYLGTYNASASPFRSEPTLFLLLLSTHKFLK